MENKTDILNLEKAFRQFRQSTTYIIQMAPDNWWVTDFRLDSAVYDVYKRKSGYKIYKKTLEDSAILQDSYIMGDNSIRELNEFFQNSRPTIFNFMGRPGSGKGTHGGHFAEIYNLPTIKVGELIRESGNDTDMTINELANTIVDSGIKNNPGKSICLDGYPRNFSQKDHFLSYLSNYRIFTVFLSANKQECMQRIEQRHDNSHTTDQNPEINERRMKKYGQYTRETIKSLERASCVLDNMYYAEISIESGVDTDVNFKHIMTNMAKTVKNKASWIQQQKIRNNQLQM